MRAITRLAACECVGCVCALRRDTCRVTRLLYVTAHVAHPVTLLVVFAIVIGATGLVAYGMIRLMRGLGNPYGLSESQQRLAERRSWGVVMAIVVLVCSGWLIAALLG
jgi:hypothetical protein